MPILVWFIDLDPEGHNTRFLGACEYSEGDAYQAKLKTLCKAMGWSTAPCAGKPVLRSLHCYLGRIPNPFEMVG